MSIGGPSALGTLLVHRLDSVLGTTLSQQANLVTGARPDAVTQPGAAERPDAAQNETQRQTRDGVDRATAQTEQQTRQATNRAKLDALAAEILAARSAPNTATTKSAPTSLGHAARTILALLANHPDQPAAVQGKSPLLAANPQSGASVHTAGPNAAAGNASRADSAASSIRGQNINVSTAAGAGTNTAAAGSASTTAATATGPSAAVPAQLAQALAQALQSSGIFYESHLNNLAYGKQSLSQLRQEPQAQVTRGPEGAAAGNSTTTSASTSNAAAPPAAAATQAAAQSHRGDASSSNPAASIGSSAASPNTGAPVPVPGLDPQTHQIVRQQLEVLANQTFAWRGEAWPDAPMEWEINRREPSREDTLLSPETEHWATRINIHLPVLGNVQARLTLAGQQIVMQLIAPESSTLLKEHAEALRERYSAIGMQLSQIAVADNAWDAAASIVDGSARP